MGNPLCPVGTAPPSSHCLQVKGGGQCGLSNYRTLCVHCHAKATRRLQAERVPSSNTSTRRGEGGSRRKGTRVANQDADGVDSESGGDIKDEEEEEEEVVAPCQG
ncbi:unnamed protein product [Discosporangium mesarthrocarpum]